VVGSTTTRFNPSSVRAPKRRRSPFSANTTSSVVKYSPILMMANPTLLVICWPLAITKGRSFFSRATPIRSSVASGIHVYSLPVSTKIFGMRYCFFPVRVVLNNAMRVESAHPNRSLTRSSCRELHQGGDLHVVGIPASHLVDRLSVSALLQIWAAAPPERMRWPCKNSGHIFCSIWRE